ncbi:UDP-N-acetylmuramate dehydrogenase [Natrinema pallidum]|nr:UDP-N-acetylmuramate dehydrogenase [Natrinema pallidum]
MISSLEEFNTIEQEVPLAPYTTWNIGGSAEYFWEPTKDELSDVLRYCEQNHIPVHFLGRGSNVLISSDGVDGLAICTRSSLQGIELQDDVIHAEAGVSMPVLANFAASYEIAGFEHLICIPGSIGAGIAINAGLAAHGRKEIGDSLIDVTVMNRSGTVFKERAEDLELGFRTSNIPDRDLFVLSARFDGSARGTEGEIASEMHTHLRKRKSKQPLSVPTAGSTFKNPSNGKSAGWLIDQAGLKGYQVGGAKVSEVHANWIENTGTATSDDVLDVINHVKRVVDDEFGIELEIEIRVLE